MQTEDIQGEKYKRETGSCVIYLATTYLAITQKAYCTRTKKRTTSLSNATMIVCSIVLKPRRRRYPDERHVAALVRLLNSCNYRVAYVSGSP